MMFLVVVVLFLVLAKNTIFPHTDTLLLFVVFYMFAVNLMFLACVRRGLCGVCDGCQEQ